MTKLSIPNAGELIARCWTNAEEALQHLVRSKYRDSDEELITNLFHRELEAQLNCASENRLVERAFLRDLTEAFPTIREYTLSSKVARGLVATVSFHAREIEWRTGGDLGIVLIRPNIDWDGFSHALHKKDYSRGLLCQAKMLRRDSRWHVIRGNQAKALRGKLSYFALLLYRYSDQNGKRCELDPFAWQLGHGATILRINRWLTSGRFPESQNSEQIIRNLAADQIGTDDPNVIEKDIAPPQKRRSLVIEVRWRDPYDPGDRMFVELDSPEVRQQQRMVIARG